MQWTPNATRAAAASLLAVSTAVLTISYSTSESRGALIRNSLVAQPAVFADFNWTPEDRPETFRGESYPVPHELTLAVDSLSADDSEGSPAPLPIAKSIIRHLHSSPGNDLAIRSDILTTYRRIVDNGDGYCADFTRVFISLSHSLGIPVRHWGMGTNNMGPGHTFVEVFSEDLGAWIFVDPYFSFFIVDKETHIPLDVLSLADRLESKPESVEVVPIVSHGFTFPNTAHALRYYINGIDYVYLLWGDNVVELSENAPLTAVRDVSRSGEILLSILTGIYPKVRPFPTGSGHNKKAIEELFQLRRLLLASLAVFLLLSCAAIVEGYLAFSRSRSSAKIHQSQFPTYQALEIPPPGATGRGREG